MAAIHNLLTRLSTFLYRRPRVALALLLFPPLLWLGVAYVGALGALLVQSFYGLDHYTGQVVRSFTLESYAALASRSNLDIILRTVAMAAAVTVAAVIFAFPLAFYMTFHASGRWRALLYLAVILPLWSSYIVRLYSWKLILAKEGVLSWVVEHTGLMGILDSWLSLPLVGGWVTVPGLANRAAQCGERCIRRRQRVADGGVRREHGNQSGGTRNRRGARRK